MDTNVEMKPSNNDVAAVSVDLSAPQQQHDNSNASIGRVEKNPIDEHAVSVDTSPPHKQQNNKNRHRRQNTSVDRGYAWIILIADFIVIVLHAVVGSTNTLFYQALREQYQLNAATAGWVLSLGFSVRLLSSPFVGLLYTKLPYRTVATTGGVVFTIGMLVMAFANGLWMLYCGSMLQGIGGNMVTMSSFIILSVYFKKKRALAVGIAFTGNGVGSMIFPQLVAKSFALYGFTQTLIFVACVILQVVVAAALYRPLLTNTDYNHAQAETAKSSSSRSTTDSSSSSTSSSPSASSSSSMMSSTWQLIRNSSGFEVLHRPVLVCFIIVVLSVQCLVLTVYIYVSGLAMEKTNMSANEIAGMLSFAALAEFCKIPLGLCFDLPIIRGYRMYLYSILCLTMGVSAILLTFSTQYVTFSTCYALFHVCSMAALSQFITMFGDLVKIEQISTTIAVSRTLAGIAQLFIPPAVGKSNDIWGSFQNGFIIVSVFHIAIVAGYIIVYFLSKRKTKTNNKMCF